jgi:hypothetical protein
MARCHSPVFQCQGLDDLPVETVDVDCPVSDCPEGEEQPTPPDSTRTSFLFSSLCIPLKPLLEPFPLKVDPHIRSFVIGFIRPVHHLEYKS